MLNGNISEVSVEMQDHLIYQFQMEGHRGNPVCLHLPSQIQTFISIYEKSPCLLSSRSALCKQVFLYSPATWLGPQRCCKQQEPWQYQRQRPGLWGALCGEEGAELQPAVPWYQCTCPCCECFPGREGEEQDDLKFIFV